MTQGREKDRLGPLKIPFLLIAILWISFFVTAALKIRVGLVPRSREGLWGIFFMPFFHADLAHLIGNTIPLFILTVLAVVAGRGWATLASLTILGGVFLWIFGQNAIHIGASGLVYALAGLIITRGLVERRAIPILVSIGVAVAYGGILLSGLLPTQEGVSWDGHLTGGIAGILTAVDSKGRKPPRKP